jgi:lipopolysaccharide export system protein LptA
MTRLKRYLLPAIAMIVIGTHASALPEDRNLPIKGTADQKRLDLNSGQYFLTNNVVIFQGNLSIYADTVTIERDSTTQEISYILAKGNPVRFIDTPSADGKILEIEANTIEFLPNENGIIAFGNAKITQEGTFARGERIEYNTVTAIMNIKGGEDEQAEFIIQPGTLN